MVLGSLIAAYVFPLWLLLTLAEVIAGGPSDGLFGVLTILYTLGFCRVLLPRI